MTNSPHYYLRLSVNMEHTLAARNVHSLGAKKEKVSLNSVLAKLVALALERHPMINSSWGKDRILLYRRKDIAVAVATENGLLAPVVRSCEAKTVSQIDVELEKLIENARQGKLHPEEYQNPTFTISNLGMYDLESFTAIINPPAAAILAVGKIIEKPVGINGEIVLKPMMEMIMSCDHRVIDGAVGAAFLKDLKDIIEEPLLALF